MKIVKVEYLISPYCNISCEYCKLKKKTWGKILTLEEVKKSIDIIYNYLGAKFIAFYGKEPMELGVDYWVELCDYLRKYQKMGKGYTLITNGLKLTDEILRKLMSAGLDSLTCSVDATCEVNWGDVNMTAKSRVGYDKLRKAKEMGIRDACGIITITHQNLDFVKRTINKLSSLGIWSSLDVIHFNKGKYNLSPSKIGLNRYMIKITDLYKFRDLVEWIESNRSRLKVFQSIETLEKFKTSTVLDLDWKCVSKEFNYPTSITVGADGKLSCCDNYFHPEMEKYSIFDVENKWEEIESCYVKSVGECSGCYWSTHKMAQEAFLNEKKLEHFIHK